MASRTGKAQPLLLVNSSFTQIPEQTKSLFALRACRNSEGHSSPLLPQLVEQLHSRRSITRIVIVGIGEHRNPASGDFVDYVDPFPKVRAPVNDGLVPNLRPFLDSLSISNPTNVGKIRCDRVHSLE